MRSIREKNEYALFEAIEESIENKALKLRLTYLLKLYDRKAQTNRHWYHFLHILSVFLPTVATMLGLLTVLGGEQHIAAISSILTLLTTFILGLQNQFRCYENWIRYRSTAELIKSEVFCCLFGGDIYCGNITEREHSLAIKIEEIARGETAQWRSLYVEQPEKELGDSKSAHRSV